MPTSTEILGEAIITLIIIVASLIWILVDLIRRIGALERDSHTHTLLGSKPQLRLLLTADTSTFTDALDNVIGTQSALDTRTRDVPLFRGTGFATTEEEACGDVDDVEGICILRTGHEPEAHFWSMFGFPTKATS